MMPGMGGLGLLDHVREHHAGIPIIMISSVSDLSMAVGTLRNGAYDYLLKPFERDQLLGTVLRALEYRALVEQNNLYRMHLEELVVARTEMLNSAIGDLERSYDITLEALGDALDLKDAETEGHSRRVTAYTIALARAMKLAPQEIRTIARGAFLHDVGKMAIPDAILLKPGRLTQDEQSTMREHCARGYQMLRKIPFLRDAAEIVYTHQEHFDGRGYPRGLRGEEIPLGARIFAVADALDAITSDRPYRSGSSFGTARSEIQKHAGSQFDPQVVEVFLQMPERLWSDLRAEIESQSAYGAATHRQAAAGTPPEGGGAAFDPFSIGAFRQQAEVAGLPAAVSPADTRPIRPLAPEALAAALGRLGGWNIEEGALTRMFLFPDFPSALAFVQALGGEAERARHHPDIDLRYDRVRVSLVTHDAGGITEKDTAMAQRSDELARPLDAR
jgi:putative nucleotidyltransferase with HDIG domain